MEKEHQPDSMSTVNMKPDYPPSEVYSTSEPPPAYRRPRSTAVQIARIAAITIILSSMILGGFILAASYVQARAGCQELQQLDALLDKEMALEAREMQNEDEIPRRFSVPQALHQDAPSSDSLKKVDTLHAEESRPKNEEKLQSLDSQSQDSSTNSQSTDSSESNDSSENDSNDQQEDSAEEMGKIPIRIQLPLHLDLDDIAGALMEKNLKSRMNCVIEKRRAEELVDHQPRSVQLPFGLNLTTPPRLEKVTGERMAIICESGNEQRIPENVEVLRGFPIPLGGPVSLPIQFPVPPMSPYRPPMPAQHMQAPSPQAPQDYQTNSEDVSMQRQNIPQFIARHLNQPHRVMFIREQTIPQQESRQLPFLIREQIPNQVKEQEMPQPQLLQFQIREEEPRPQQMEFQFREESEPQIPLQVREQIGQHIKEQLMRQQQMREQMAQMQQQNSFQARGQMPYQSMEQMRPPFMREQQQEQVQIPKLPLQMALIPREVRIHIQRVQLPQVESDEVPQDSHSTSQDQQAEEPMGLPITAEELQAVHQAVEAAEEDQEQEQKAQEQQAQQAEEQRVLEERNSMMERQAMERSRPVDIPVPMMTKENETPVQDIERPHYVQPRSVKSKRSIDSVLHREKRVKRCNCDCAC